MDPFDCSIIKINYDPQDCAKGVKTCLSLPVGSLVRVLGNYRFLPGIGERSCTHKS